MNKLSKAIATLAVSLTAVHQVPAAQAKLSDASASVVALTCNGIDEAEGWKGISNLVDSNDKAVEWVAVDPERFFFFVATQSGAIVSKDEAIQRIKEAFESSQSEVQPDKSISKTIFDIVVNIQGSIRSDSPQPLKPRLNDDSESRSDPSMSDFWIDDADYIRCPREAKAVAPAAGEDKQAKKPIGLKLALRQTADALPLAGDDRKAAPAAAITFSRDRSYLDDGNRKEVKNLDFKGVLGLGLAPNSDAKLFVYGGYEYSRSRTKPSTPPMPPATLRDGDTDVITVGVLASQFYDLDPDQDEARYSLALGVNAEFLTDLVKDSDRLRARVSATPFFPSPFPQLCGVRYFRPTFIKGLRGRCTFDGVFQFNHVTKLGKLVAGNTDNFAFVGGKAAYDLMLSNDMGSGIFAGAAYEYQASIGSQLPDIERHHLFVKYRWWQSDQFAIEWGLNLEDGINPDSFANENKLSLSVGFIF